jgi:hypothetical protein
MMDATVAPGRGPTRGRLLRRARHYQDLARRHHDEERFWLCRAAYFGRQAAHFSLPKAGRD